MKPSFAPTVIAALALATMLTGYAYGEEAEFPGVQKAMSAKSFTDAGLNKLSPEELARLNEFIAGYANSKSQEAANVAVDRAVKDNKIASQPQIIESRIVGRFTGYNGRTSFTLENGQVWKQSQDSTGAYPPSDSPPVLLKKEFLGWRMYILGGGNLRVHKVR
ncbi:MAG: hypothetical protein M3Y69_01775 [Verrucomicrobiota bacterium]|nr:hypothetical protein [Verrucomicrobiota bacterium]